MTTGLQQHHRAATGAGTTDAPGTDDVPPALARLRPRPPVPPDVVHRGDVSPLAWAGMVADGLLVPLWGTAARTVGTAETPRVRAAAVAPLVPARGVVGRRTAVWVHTGGPAPRRAEVLVGSGVRRPDPHPGRWVAEAALSAQDLVALGPVRVTTPQRTAIDVARWEPAEDARIALARLVTQCGVDLDAALEALAVLDGHRGVRRARELLRRVAASTADADDVRPG